MQNEELTLSILRNIDTLKTQKTLSQELGISIGKVNYVLNALIDKGLIKAESFFANKQKNQYRYLLTEDGIKEKIELTTKFIERKKAEYDVLVLELERYNEGILK
ncbi:MarR family EPS-associated transcriptional regulator [Sulfurovum sp.]|uniref:MarR family EPS-associated transcriptional regulator n=1 Tax=Sulfurovum sp. TaxID=1969726 RepID=UPI0028681002|nr:MarR family EPS-associated transcriptional regulator [Sulfurovum sp.]